MGMNVVRVYLHDLAWYQDPEGFKARIGQFLALADSHGIRTMFVFFDDCWNEDPKPGKQPEPRPSVHNSGCVQSPGKAVAGEPELWGLEAYVTDISGTFARDTRVLCWDLYTEPGNSGYGEKSLPLLQRAFEWARSTRPIQPLTAGLWTDNEVLNRFQRDSSDIITFHNYGDADSLARDIERFQAFGRPVICTEWLRRGASEVASSLPLFQHHRVGCINWGLVSGKTQTIYAWGTEEGAPEPERWFHDLLNPDGTPYDPLRFARFASVPRTNGPPAMNRPRGLGVRVFSGQRGDEPGSPVDEKMAGCGETLAHGPTRTNTDLHGQGKHPVFEFSGSHCSATRSHPGMALAKWPIPRRAVPLQPVPWLKMARRKSSSVCSDGTGLFVLLSEKSLRVPTSFVAEPLMRSSFLLRAASLRQPYRLPAYAPVAAPAIF